MRRTAANPLRVVLDARVPDGAYGGVQQWIIGLAQAFSNIPDGNDEFIFLTVSEHDAWLKPFVSGPSSIFASPATRGQSPVLAALRSRVASVPGARAVWRAARSVSAREPSLPVSDGSVERLGADLVHFTLQDAFATSIPSIYQPWDLQHRHLPAFFSRHERARRDITYRAFSERAATVITASKWVKDDLIEQYGLDPDRIAVVNVPPATAAYAEPTIDELEATRRRLQLPDRFIYYPAQTWPHKNHGRLFRALGHLRRSGIDVHLVCSGHPNEHQRAANRAARDAGVMDMVRFVGFLPPLDVVALYRLAHAMVFPSLYEGWGLPILEAFRAQLPVACSSATSLPELVGDAALVFDPYDERAIADAIHAVWADDARREILAERGRLRAECFSWDRVAMTLRAHYRRVARRTLDERDRSLLAAVSRV